MNRVIFLIVFLLLGALANAENLPDVDSRRGQTPDPKTPPPAEKGITHSEEVPGATQEHEGEVSTRQEFIYPSNYGTAGIFRVRSAESLPEGALTFGVGGEFYSVANPFGVGNANTIAESLFIGYSPTDRLTLAVMRKNSSTTFGDPQQLISSLGDINFSGMYAFPVSSIVTVAPIFNFLVASNFNDLAPAGSTVSVGGGLATTLNLWPATGVPLFLHGNLIYHMPQIRMSKQTLVVEPESFFNFSRFHTVTLGVGAELKLGDFIPFLEFGHIAHMESAVNWGNSPSKVSVGARMTPLSNKSLAFLLGTDIALSRGLAPGVPYSPGYQIIGQVSYTVGVTQTERKHYYTTQDVNVVDRKFVIKKNIRFKVGKADLESDSTHLLDQIADVVRENHVKKLLIVGHTDSSHTEDYNLKLSLARATTVKNYLVSKGIPEESLMVQGYGKRKPKASNLTEEGRIQNRRVEFIIVE